MITQEIKVDGEVRAKRSLAGAAIAFPPVERSEAAAAKIKELMDNEPFPTQDEIFNTPELMKQVEDAARAATPDNASPKPKRWQQQMVVKDQKGRTVRGIPPEDDTAPPEALDANDDVEVEDEEPQEHQGEQIDQRLLRQYLVGAARVFCANILDLDRLSNDELAQILVASGKRYATFDEWLQALS